VFVLKFHHFRHLKSRNGTECEENKENGEEEPFEYRKDGCTSRKEEFCGTSKSIYELAGRGCVLRAIWLALSTPKSQILDK
jgi:hypothetical protein